MPIRPGFPPLAAVTFALLALPALHAVGIPLPSDGSTVGSDTTVDLRTAIGGTTRAIAIADGATLTVHGIHHPGAGGAVSVEAGGALTILPTSADGTGAVVFSDNTVSPGYPGGAIFNNGGTVTLANALFSGNATDTGTWGGGAIYNAGTLTLTNTAFVNNSGSSNMGGAIFNTGTTTLTDVAFTGNASRYSGAIHNYTGTVTLNVTADLHYTGNTLTGGNAGPAAGFLYAEAGTTTIFAIADDATLTIGRDPDAIGYNSIHDSLASASADTPTLTKTGAGALVLNADNSAYVGAFNIEAGTVEFGTVYSAPGGAIANAGTILLAAGDTRFASLSGDGGTVRFKNLGETLTLGTLSGSQTFANLEVNLVTGQSDKIVVTGAATGSHTLQLAAVGGAPAGAAAIPGIVTTGGGDATFAGTLDVGMFTYELADSESAADTWDLVQTGAVSSTGQALLNTVGAMSTGWFAQLETVSRRMGELRLAALPRTASASVFAPPPVHRPGGDYWVRATGGQTDADLGAGLSPFREYRYGADVGVDWRRATDADSVLALGFFTGYQRAERRLRDGSGGTGDTDDLHAGLYASWLHTSGWFVESVLKLQRFDNSYTANSGGIVDKADFETWGAGLSLDAGRQFALRDGWFVEPSAQAAWLRAAGKDYVTSTALAVDVDDADIWQFGVSVRAGKTIGLSDERVVQPYAKLGATTQISDGGEVRAGGGQWRPNTDGQRGVAGAGVIWTLSRLDRVHFDYEAGWGDKYERPWSVSLGYHRSW